jgi:hypothetical protein
MLLFNAKTLHSRDQAAVFRAIHRVMFGQHFSENRHLGLCEGRFFIA